MSASALRLPTNPNRLELPQTEAVCIDAVLALLDESAARISCGDIVGALHLLQDPLARLWQSAGTSVWADALRWRCRAHPVHTFLQRDPLAGAMAGRYSGACGEAERMDYLCRGVAPPGTDAAGRSLFRISSGLDAVLSLCHRRQSLCRQIDATVAAQPDARILAVECGLAGELHGSLALSPLFAGEFVAMNAHSENCAAVQQAFPQPQIVPWHADIPDLFKAETQASGTFDLIYCAGAFDRLSDSLARRLLRCLLQRLRPQGRLLVTNFQAQGSARAYLELFMHWELVYRTEAELCALATYAGAGTISLLAAPCRNISCLVLGRATELAN